MSAKKTPTLEMAQRYQAIYDHFNEHLFKATFGQPLPRAILNLSRARGKGTVAFFAPMAWTDPESKKKLHEISLVPEWTHQEPKRIVSALVHEMAHMLDHIQGTAAKHGYHSKTWFKLMKRIGLPGKPIRGSLYNVDHDIDPDGLFEQVYDELPTDLVLPYVTNAPRDGLVPRKQTLQGKRARYQCPQCALVAYAKYEAALYCGSCEIEMTNTTPQRKQPTHSETPPTPTEEIVVEHLEETISA